MSGFYTIVFLLMKTVNLLLKDAKTRNRTKQPLTNIKLVLA